MKSISLEIITPEKVILRDKAEFVVVPAFRGELGVLPGHAPLLAQLAPGRIRINKENEIEQVVTQGGFIEVHPDKMKIFADSAEVWLQMPKETRR